MMHEGKYHFWINNAYIFLGSRVNTACQFGFVSLDMLNTTVSDSGEYICVVSNNAGTTQSSCRMVVQPRKDMEPDFYSQGKANFIQKYNISKRVCMDFFTN